MANNRKSIKEKRMSGTYRPDRDGGKEDIEWGKLDAVPDPPEYFSAYAIVLWNVYCQELIERNDLCTVYLGSLEQYCYAIDLAQRAAEQLNDSMVTPSKANPAVSPHFRIWQQATKTVSEIGAMFGFSPKSRLNVPGTEKKSPMSNLLK